MGAAKQIYQEAVDELTRLRLKTWLKITASITVTNWEDLVGLEGVTAVQEARLQSLSLQTLVENILFKL